MEIFGIGIGEILLILLIVLILFNPKDIVASSRKIGQGLNRLVRSPIYKLLNQTGQEIKNLPQTFMRETNLEEIREEIKQEVKDVSEDLEKQKTTIGAEINRSFDE
jgi:Sec-independent protein translocase protein TatA